MNNSKQFSRKIWELFKSNLIKQNKELGNDKEKIQKIEKKTLKLIDSIFSNIGQINEEAVKSMLLLNELFHQDSNKGYLNFSYSNIKLFLLKFYNVVKNKQKNVDNNLKERIKKEYEWAYLLKLLEKSFKNVEKMIEDSKKNEQQKVETTTKLLSIKMFYDSIGLIVKDDEINESVSKNKNKNLKLKSKKTIKNQKTNIFILNKNETEKTSNTQNNNEEQDLDKIIKQIKKANKVIKERARKNTLSKNHAFIIVQSMQEILQTQKGKNAKEEAKEKKKQQRLEKWFDKERNKRLKEQEKKIKFAYKKQHKSKHNPFLSSKKKHHEEDSQDDSVILQQQMELH
ncbi:MAG: hypothetical protein LBF02_00405 [Mycoplasmataceae bacterium]|nr:hypothetical protein [Mycoplasmataceae bacterium]